jgi:hypothetical protein
MYPVEYTMIRNEIHATRFVMMIERGSASTPASRPSEDIHGIWLCTSAPTRARGIRVAAEIALARANPTAV